MMRELTWVIGGVVFCVSCGLSWLVTQSWPEAGLHVHILIGAACGTIAGKLMNWWDGGPANDE